MTTLSLSRASICLLTATLAACGDAPDPAAENKELVVSAMQAFFADKDATAVETYVAADYTQHNPTVENGPQALAGLITQLAGNPYFTWSQHRAIADADLVTIHSRFGDVMGPGQSLIAMDIFRVEDGKIAEHWDCLQPEPALASGQPAKNPSGRTMLDGTTSISPHDAASGKAAVQAYLDSVLVAGQQDRIGAWFVGDGAGYVQHDPNIGDGLAAFRGFLTAAGPLRYTRIGKVIAEGDFVVSQAEGLLGKDAQQQHLVFYDIFRTANDAADGKPKIVEHWSCAWPYVDASLTRSGLPML